MQFDTLLERTDAGISEIYNKSNRLTQSERVVLLMIDGRADVAALIEKMPSLSMPRVFMAIRRLGELGLISERIMSPTAEVPTVEIEDDVRQQFLQQTADDPVTIIRMPSEGVEGPTTIPPGQFDRMVKQTTLPMSPAQEQLNALMHGKESPAPAPVELNPAATQVIDMAKQQETIRTQAARLMAEGDPNVEMIEAKSNERDPLETVGPTTVGAFATTGAVPKPQVAPMSRTQSLPVRKKRKAKGTPWYVYAVMLFGVVLIGVATLQAMR
ncbi:MAG TPA: hypothetical protein VFK82_11100 [Burkholderiaceae bacterium]|nr:hypothetical protein [Burkholderiaceae bacterium]